MVSITMERGDQLQLGHRDSVPAPPDPLNQYCAPLVVVEGVVGYENKLHTQPNYFCVKYKQHYCHYLFGIYFDPKVLIQLNN